MADYAEGPFERIVNVGWGGAAVAVDLFAVDGEPEGGGTYEIRFREHAAAALPSVPSYKAMFPDANGLYYAANDIDHPSGSLSQTFIAGATASVCNGGGSVALTEGGEARFSRGGLSLPVLNFQYVRRSLSGAFTMYQVATCSGDGSAGRWMQTIASGDSIDDGMRWTALSRSAGNLAVRNFLGSGASTALGRAAIWGTAPATPPSGSADGVVFFQNAGTQSTNVHVILWHLIPGAFAGTANGKDWYYHAIHGTKVVFSWPLQLTGFPTEVWLTDDGPGSGANVFGLPNNQVGVTYYAFEM